MNHVVICNTFFFPFPDDEPQAVGTGCVEALAAYEQVLIQLPEKVTFRRHSAWVPSFLEE